MWVDSGDMRKYSKQRGGYKDAEAGQPSCGASVRRNVKCATLCG